MAINPNPLPTKEDAIGFVKLVDSLRIKKNVLSGGYIFDYDEEIREQIINHELYEWAMHKGGYLRAIRYLKDNGLTGEYPPRLDIEVIYCISRVLHMYLCYESHPERLKRTTGEAATRALKHVQGLQEMFISDLQMENIEDFVDLSILLGKLQRELTGEEVTTYTTSSKGNVLDRQIIKTMYYLIDKLLGEAPGYAIWELVSIIHPVEKQSVNRRIKKLSAKP